MNRIKYFFTLLPALLCGVGTALAQVTFQTKVNSARIGKNQAVEVSFVVDNGQLGDFRPPAFGSWQIAGGPVSSSSSYSVNGKTSSSSSITYYLRPLKTGKLVVDGATALVDGRQMQSNSVLVEVQEKDVPNIGTSGSNNPMSALTDPFFEEPLPQPQQRQETQYDGYVLKEGEDVQKKISDNLFMKVDASKNSCFEGEPIVATYKLYTRVNMEARVSKRPSFNGFSSYDLDGANNDYQFETIGGKEYKVYTIRKVQLYPLQPGVQTMEPAEIETTISFKKIPRNANGNNDLQNITQPYTVKSGQVKINVMPLPGGKPAGFSGAVGNFSISASIVEKAIGKGDAGTLRLELTGGGNWAMVQPPVIQWPAGVEGYDPTTRETLNEQQVPIFGTKIFEYPFTAKTAGQLVLPAASFSYFDPAAKAYKIIGTAPITLTILPQSQRPKLDASNGAASWPEIFKDVAKWILPVAAAGLIIILLLRGRKRSHLPPLRFNPGEHDILETSTIHDYTARPAVVPADHEAYAPESLRRQAAADDPADAISSPVQHVQVTPALLQNNHWLDASMMASTQNNPQKFYQALKADLQAFIHKKFNVSLADKSGISQTLQQKGIAPETVQQLLVLTGECEQNIYSPFATNAAAEAALEEAKSLVAEMDK